MNRKRDGSGNGQVMKKQHKKMNEGSMSKPQSMSGRRMGSNKSKGGW